ncbi:hypothetical protein [Halomontanus rarus]|uniref:hypothetical protein n=1 Tax=Halomontanus rarus TaxID=3034020 RepID=UPI001A9889FB
MQNSHRIDQASECGQASQKDVRAAIEEVENEEVQESSDESTTSKSYIEKVFLYITNLEYRRKSKED